VKVRFSDEVSLNEFLPGWYVHVNDFAVLKVVGVGIAFVVKDAFAMGTLNDVSFGSGVDDLSVSAMDDFSTATFAE